MATSVSPERTPVKLALGSAARSIRKRLALTQVAFAQKVLLRQNTLSRIESGCFTPGPAKLLRFLRLAATEDERGPILKAMEAHGFRACDLSPSLVDFREDFPPSGSTTNSQREDIKDA
jgi:transcriptional regulator with XRE-family HTH domain